MWNDTVYQPGELTAVAYQNGVEVERKTVKTAGAPHHIALSAYSQTVAADGESLNYITAAIVDKDGNVCPHADHRLTFAVSGAGEFVATDAGDQRETETFLRPDKKALAGKLVCCVRASDTAGTVTVTATAAALESATLSFKTE
jgi:beta-galactosidase